MTEPVVSPAKSLKSRVLELSPRTCVRAGGNGRVVIPEKYGDTSDTTNKNNNLDIVVSPFQGGSVTGSGTNSGGKRHQRPDCSRQGQWAAMAPGEAIMLFPHADYLCFGCEKFATRLALGSIRSSLAHRRRIHPEQTFQATAVSGGIRVERLA